VDIETISQALEGSAPAEWMRHTLVAMPLVEATHVLALAIVFGTIFVVDLRLLGYPSTKSSFSRLHHDLVRWTWAAFGVAVITGVLMFLPNATTYFNNAPFLWKMAALVGAGLNMAVFELQTSKLKASWDRGVPTPTAARVAGALSILLWTSVIFLGRWIGFTKGYIIEVPDDIELDFLESGLLRLHDKVPPIWC
jgi:hypothetical protein